MSDRSGWRLFLAYAAASLMPVLILAAVLSVAFGREARGRGLAQGRAEANIVAGTAIEPLLDSQPLTIDLSTDDRTALTRVTNTTVRAGRVLRLRIWTLGGLLVFSDDGSGARNSINKEVADAAHGAIAASLTRLNGDSDDTGPVGARSVEVYLPLTVGNTRVGVLEVYLPYAPIDADVTAGLRTLYLVLGVGLATLWTILAAITSSTMRRLRRAADRNAYLADHDSLTALANRGLFQRLAEQALAGGDPVAVVVVDLDRFKEVNDTLGHHNGDALLKHLGERLRCGVRADDTVARLGGDEFGLILRGVTENEVDTLLGRLRTALESEQIHLDSLPVLVEASFGYALAPADGTDVEALLRCADVAMYQAKEAHTGIARYSKARDHFDANKLALVGQLRQAIDADELVLYYQPKTDLRTDRVCAVEALVRWQHPERGLIPPDSFLPVAEQTGLIDPLTRWVLRTALEQVRQWDDRYADLTVAVNISARNLSHPDFAEQVLDSLRASAVTPARLTLEITETALLEDPESAATVLAELARTGVHVSIDDFGRGQTSLGYLPTLPLHELKIDRSFVSDLETNPTHLAIVRAIVDLGHNLGLSVVAEGVETEPTKVILASVGCDIAQGYLLARPMPPDQLATWLATHRIVTSV